MAENHKMPLIHTNPTKNSALRSGSASQHYRYTIDLQNLPEIVFSKDHVKHSRPSEYTIIEKTLYQKKQKIHWLVVWNIFYSSIYWECHHPN